MTGFVHHIVAILDIMNSLTDHFRPYTEWESKKQDKKVSGKVEN